MLTIYIPHVLLCCHLRFPSSCSVRSAIDSITQNEESKIDYDYVMMMRNNKFEHTVEKLQTTLRCSKQLQTMLLCQRLWHRCFPMNFMKYVRAPFLFFFYYSSSPTYEQLTFFTLQTQLGATKHIKEALIFIAQIFN